MPGVISDYRPGEDRPEVNEIRGDQEDDYSDEDFASLSPGRFSQYFLGAIDEGKNEEGFENNRIESKDSPFLE